MRVLLPSASFIDPDRSRMTSRFLRVFSGSAGAAAPQIGDDARDGRGARHRSSDTACRSRLPAVPRTPNVSGLVSEAGAVIVSVAGAVLPSETLDGIDMARQSPRPAAATIDSATVPAKSGLAPMTVSGYVTVSPAPTSPLRPARRRS